MKLICGLGNPGLRYKNTRHNIGFLAIDNFARVKKVKMDKKSFSSLFGRMAINDEGGLLLKPMTYMNNSGVAVKAAIERLGVGLKDILIICDDINLKLGIIRLRAQGSAGGHKGLESIIDKLNTENFNRLRIGIGYGTNSPLKDYVLSRFKTEEKRLLKEVINRAISAIKIWIDEGIEEAMNRFNRKIDLMEVR